MHSIANAKSFQNIIHLNLLHLSVHIRSFSRMDFIKRSSQNTKRSWKKRPGKQFKEERRRKLLLKYDLFIVVFLRTFSTLKDRVLWTGVQSNVYLGHTLLCVFSRRMFFFLLLYAFASENSWWLSWFLPSFLHVRPWRVDQRGALMCGGGEGTGRGARS